MLPLEFGIQTWTFASFLSVPYQSLILPVFQLNLNSILSDKDSTLLLFHYRRLVTDLAGGTHAVLCAGGDESSLSEKKKEEAVDDFKPSIPLPNPRRTPQNTHSDIDPRVIHFHGR